MGEGEIFGQEEMFFDSSKKFEAKTLAESHIFQIEKEVSLLKKGNMIKIYNM